MRGAGESGSPVSISTAAGRPFKVSACRRVGFAALFSALYIASVSSLAVQPRGGDYRARMSLPPRCPVFDARGTALHGPFSELDGDDRAFKKSFTAPASAPDKAAKCVSGVGVGVGFHFAQFTNFD